MMIEENDDSELLNARINKNRESDKKGKAKVNDEESLKITTNTRVRNRDHSTVSQSKGMILFST